MVDIIHRIGIKAQASKVFAAVSTPEGIAGWWTRDTTGSAGAGGKITTRFQDTAGKEVAHMEFQLTKLDPDKEVRWRFLVGPAEWIGTDITFELARSGDQTIVLFGHRNWKEAVEFTSHCSMKWATFLLSLRELLEKGQGRPAPGDLKIDDWN